MVPTAYMRKLRCLPTNITRVLCTNVARTHRLLTSLLLLLSFTWCDYVYSPIQSDNGRPSTPKPTTPLSRTAEGRIFRNYKFEATGEYAVSGTFKATRNGVASPVGSGAVVTFNVSEAKCSLAMKVHPEDPFKCQCVLGATQTKGDPDSCTFCKKGTFGHVVSFGRVDTMQCMNCPAGAMQGGKVGATSIKACLCDDPEQLLFVKQAFPKTHGTCKCVFGGSDRQTAEMSCDPCKPGEYASLDISRCTECNDPRMRRKTRDVWLAAVEVAVETKVAETAAALLKAAVDSAENDDAVQTSTIPSAVGKNQANMDIDGVIRKGVFDRCLVATNTHLDCYPCECNEKYYLGYLVANRQTTRTDDNAGDALPPYVEAPVATCIPCPKNADCPAGTRGLPNVIVRPGFWRSSIRSATIYPCRNIPQDLLSGVPDMKINCLGGKKSVCATIVNDATKPALDACGKQLALTPESKEYEPDLHRAAVRSFFVNSNASASSCKPPGVPADWRPDWNPRKTSQTRFLADQTASQFSTNTTKGFVGTWESVLCGECPLNTGRTTGGASW